MPAAETKRLEGKPIALKIQEEIKVQAAEFVSKTGQIPCLRALQVSADPSAEWYLRQQEKMAEKLGIRYEKISHEKIGTQKELLAWVKKSNEDKSVHGLFVTMPLPEGFQSNEVLFQMDLRKDVEGIHPSNLGLIVLRQGKLIPPTAFAAFTLIESTGIALRGKHAVLIGQSAIVGRPLQMLLGEKRASTFVCNTGTSEERMQKAVQEADIVIACAGQPGRVKGDWIQEGQIVIDVGTTEVNGKIVGDVEFEKASQKAAYITPVPGGVGPLTVTMLIRNLMQACFWQQGFKI